MISERESQFAPWDSFMALNASGNILGQGRARISSIFDVFNLNTMFIVSEFLNLWWYEHEIKFLG